MSKLIEELNRVRKGPPRPMGFGTGPAVSEGKKMLLVVSLSEDKLEALADSAREADAVILAVSSGDAEKSLARAGEGLGEVIWGVQPGGKARSELSVLAKSGADFIVLSPEMPLIPDAGEVGKVLVIEASLGNGMLRAVNGLPVEAVLVAIEREGGLTWHDLMTVQRLAGGLSKPLLVLLPANVTADELQALGEVGVKGVVIPLKPGHPKERIKELREAIRGLVFKPKESKEKATPFLPLVSGEKETVAEDEEEEE